MDTKSVIARFEAERQALAMMDHPNIAKIYDAGATDSPTALGTPASLPARSEIGEAAGRDAAPPGGAGAESKIENRKSEIPKGRPYFVMELVRGIKITDYCDEKNLSTRERLGLFSQVCHAIQHAHQKGIIHRDIKPSNVLVTVNDGVAVPKVIDFGIAKATTEQRLTDKTVFTAFEQFIGTPAYMSPEQAEITSLDIDTRSDIYSLGVLLYELLTGKTPFDPKELLQAGFDEMRRTIREVEPMKPSTRLTQELARTHRPLTPSLSPAGGEGVRRTGEGESRSTANLQHLKQLIPLLRGDLDWIVMKCLEKDRARRYETANVLASDIQRHLTNEPVVACPPSNLYKFQKLVRRNKVAFAAGAGIAAALVIGLAIALWQSIEKTRAYKRAVAAERDQIRLRQQAQANEQMSRTEALKSKQLADFFENVLGGAAPEIAKGRDATLLKEIMQTTAQRMSAQLANDPETEAYFRERIAHVYHDLADYPAAEQMQRRALDLRRRLHPDGHRNVAKVLDELGSTLLFQGRLAEAESLNREALEMGKKIPNLNPADQAAWLNDRALILRHQAKFAEAEAASREALALNRKSLGNEHREVAATLNNLAIALTKQNKFGEAEATLHEAIDLSKKLFGNDHPFIAQSLATLTLVLTSQDKLKEAEAVGREAVAMQQRLLGPEHPNVATAMANLAFVLERADTLPEAESLERQALAIRRKAFGNEHALVAHSLLYLGILLGKQGNPVEGEAMLRECLEVTQKLPPNEFVDLEHVYFELVKVLNAEGKTDEAQKFFDEAQPLRKDLKK